MADEPNDTDQIEQDLARTRARMDERLDALQEKMAPAQIVNDAFAHIGGSDGAAFTETLLARAKANPLAVALVGIGFAWMMTPQPQRPRRLSQSDEDMLARRLRLAEAAVRREEGEPEDTFNNRVHTARGRVLGIERNDDEPPASYGERITQAIETARQALRERTHDAQAGASDALTDAGARFGRGSLSLHQGSRNMARDTRTNLASLKSNPLALGGLAAVAGLIVGSLLPTTEMEERTLGSAAGKLKDRGRDMAQDLADTGGRVVNQALDTARESASREGLTADKPIGEALAALKSGDLAGSVKQVAADALNAGKEAAKDAPADARGADSAPVGQA
jgi:ElaB/YqjD/DUF883 family membrane-anchored ribosome-binding protein